jgi:hypothetical protein
VAGTQLRIDGLAELRTALLALPQELVRDAGEIVQAQANEAARQIAAAYPVVTGNLRDHLRLEVRSMTAGSASVTVKNTAHHAWLFDHGTGPRRLPNGKPVGSMPKNPTLIPIAMQRRRIMVAALVDLVERTGLHVIGTSA